MDHAVGFGEGADDTAGIARRKRERRNVAGDNTSGTDHTAVADRDAGTDDHIRAKPAVAADFDRFCVTEPFRLTIAVQHQTPLVGQHGMKRRYNGQIRPEVVVVADRNRSIILNGQIVVEETAFPDPGVTSIVEKDRSL